MKFNIFNYKKKPKRIHLDYASTTPVQPEVFSAMEPYFSREWANPSALYQEGVKARRAIEQARAEVARTLRVRATDITFTSGGTESNNLALIGLAQALHDTGRAYADMEIISTRIEHASVLETLVHLEKRGVCIKYVPADEEGKINVQELESLFTQKTILVTFAYANSEIGVVQDVKKISRAVRLYNEAHSVRVLIHLDASQAPLWLSCAQDQLGVDMMTLDAGKCYGPKGVGILSHRHWVKLSPVIYGGGQEAGLRSGTENPALVVGCAEAIVRAQKHYESRSLAVAKLRDECITLLTHEIPEAVINGSITSRIANNINISIPHLDTEYAVIWLDHKGFAISTKSACGTGDKNGSSVVREITHDEARALSTLRLTFGEETTQKDFEQCMTVLKEFQTLMKKGITVVK